MGVETEPMLQPRHMLLLARWILVFGCLSLISGGVRLFRRAIEAGLPVWHLFWILPVAAALGAFKARVVMRRRMRENIRRLRSSTDKLWFWQIYPPQLLAFIVTMVVLMAVLKRVLADSATGLGALGGVDAAVAVALIVASFEYREGAAAPEGSTGLQPR